jgi:SPX domain protein involved in polyphosphate accumulation
MQNRQDHFAYCVQLFGGTTAFSRRLRIDERAVRRFINGEKPVSDNLLEDTAKALRELIAEASEAVEQISATSTSEPRDP